MNLKQILERLSQINNRLTELFAKDIGELSEDEAAEISTLNTEAEGLAAKKAEFEKLDAIRTRTAAAQAEAGKAVNNLPAPQAPAVIDSDHWKFDGISAGDIAMTIQLLNEGQRSGRSKHGSSDAAVKSLAMRLESSETREDEGYRESYGLMRKQMGGAFVKADELNQSTLAGYGDEWVGIAYGNALWNSIRHETPILQAQMAYAVPQPAGAETMTFHLEGADPVWYLVNQASDLTANPGGVPTGTVSASKVGTGKQDRTMAKLGARVIWSGEFEEDTVVNSVAELRRQMAVSGVETLESLIINGDTEAGATANINDIAGTPVGNEYWLGLDGYRKLALVTNTANSRDGGAIATADYIETIKLMGLAGKNALGSDRVAFIPDLWTYWKSLELSDVKTRDVNSQATVEEGKLIRVYGFPVMPSANMHLPSADATYGLKANAAGKIDQDTASNNSTGSLLAVRWDQWRPGFRRQITTETTRVPSADATEIVSLLRFGMIRRDNEASAISYNLTV